MNRLKMSGFAGDTKFLAFLLASATIALAQEAKAPKPRVREVHDPYSSVCSRCSYGHEGGLEEP
jgi:invasion protein IalB